MAELGYVMAQGKSGIGDQMAMILGEEAARLPDIARDTLKALACSLDRRTYAARHLLENFFAKLAQFRTIATRYDKTARNFLAAVHLAASVSWLN
jgi:transposase